MLVRLLLTVLFALAVADPCEAQDEYAREFPTKASFAELIQIMRAGTQDGFVQLRGERRDDEHWTPICPDGLKPDLSREPGEERHRIYGSKSIGRFFLTYSFERRHAPTDSEAAAMEADFKTLRAQLLAAEGEWGFSSLTTEEGTRRAELIGTDSVSKIILVLNREQDAGERGWWRLTLIGIGPYVDVEPMKAAAPQAILRRPTQAGFDAVVEVMKAGAHDGLKLLKGMVTPRKNWGKNGGMRSWGIMPMEGLESDPKGKLHSMAYYGRTDRDNGTTAATYYLGSAVNPTAEQAAALEEQFVLLRSWLARHTQGWGTAEEVRPGKYLNAGSRRFALVPLPGVEVHRIDGQPVPRIELWLSKWPIDGGGESWSLRLCCSAQGDPGWDDGTSEWIYELLSESEPATELPDLPAEFEELILALVADAPNSFSSFFVPGEATKVDFGTYKRRIDDPITISSQPRRRLTVHLTDTPDPGGVRDIGRVISDDWRSEAIVNLSYISVHDPNALTRREIDMRLEQIVARLAAVLPGWRSSISDLPGGKEDFKVRLGSLKGLRPDGHPIWIDVERMRYPIDVPGYPYGDTMQLALYVSTDHKATVGYDLFGQWRAALDEGKEPVTSAVRILGDPFEGKLLATDRVVPPRTGPLNLVELFGIHGEQEVRLEIVRDGHYDELVLTPSHVTLDRWRELQAECERGELPISALSLVGSRLPTQELVELVRQLVDAGESDFAELPPANAEWLVRTDERELATVAIPLWDATDAPTREFVKTLRTGLANTFDAKWIIEPKARNSGPFWDWYARQTYWSARYEGPKGVHPWVELVQTIRGDRMVVELQVHAFSRAHREANAETPERLWFQPLGGDCVDGRGVAYCYRDGLSFDGPFVNGLAHGTGEHIFADGTAHVDVRYERGDMRYRGHVKPPPPPVAVYSDLDDNTYDLRGNSQPSDWRNDWMLDDGTIDPVPTPSRRRTRGPRYATCVGCNGSREQWYSYEVEEYRDDIVFSGSTLWKQGYRTIRTSYGTRTVSEIGPCGYCNGTGRQRY